MSFPASQYEMVAPDYTMPTKSVRFPHFTEGTAARLVKAPTKRELPRPYCGLMPERFVCTAFQWRWWGLRDDWGNFVATKPQTDNPQTHKDQP